MRLSPYPALSGHDDDGPSTTLCGLADHQHAGLIMKASRFHDPGPKPTKYVGFGPGSWKPGHAGPEAATARHFRNSRTTAAAARRQSDGLFRGGPVEGGGWLIDPWTPRPPRPVARRAPAAGVRPGWLAGRSGWIRRMGAVSREGRTCGPAAPGVGLLRRASPPGTH